jgi:hypothetical protein
VVHARNLPERYFLPTQTFEYLKFLKINQQLGFYYDANYLSRAFEDFDGYSNDNLENGGRVDSQFWDKRVTVILLSLSTLL